ncbi:MAG: ABC transporter substrate-binding protein [Lachnospiraceae bacterium]|nr:ABC transporter substrate-binding protein [Lachnospiraceae bacterium]
MIKKTILKDYRMNIKSKRIMAAAFSLMLAIGNSTAAFAMEEEASELVSAVVETEENLVAADITETEQKLTAVTLNEVAHSIFYAPQYVAMELGYFEEEGIDLTVVTGFGADKTMTALISGEADIGFMGSESSIYTYSGGAADAPVNFAQLTQRAENFVVAREDTDDFEWSDLVGKDVLGGRAGGMPEMVFEYILKENGIDPSEVNINQSIDFGSTAAAFSGGQGDYTIEFEPSATALEQEGVGYVVESLGTASGYVPYTAYCAKESYLEEQPEVIQAFTNALQKGMDYVNSHTPEEIAAVIAPQFPENDEETIATIVKRYYEQDTWKEDLIFEEESFALLQDILESAGELKERVPYEKLVTIEFAEAAVQ